MKKSSGHERHPATNIAMKRLGPSDEMPVLHRPDPDAPIKARRSPVAARRVSNQMIAPPDHARIVESVTFEQIPANAPCVSGNSVRRKVAGGNARRVRSVPRRKGREDQPGPVGARRIPRKPDRGLERLNERHFIEQSRRLERPLRILEDDVEIDGNDLGELSWEGPNGQVQKPLLLPDRVSRANSHDVADGFDLELTFMTGAFHGKQPKATGSRPVGKVEVTLQLFPESRRVEEGCDQTQIGWNGSGTFSSRPPHALGTETAGRHSPP